MKKLYCICAQPTHTHPFALYLQKVVSVNSISQARDVPLLIMSSNLDAAMTFPSFKRAKEAANEYFNGKKWAIVAKKVEEETVKE